MNENTWDGSGWTALAMERYLTMVYRLAHARTGSVQDAEDVAQDVMLRLSRHERSIRSEEHLKAWLIRATANRANSLFRSAWRRRTLPLEAAAWTERPEPPQHDALTDALSALSPKQRVAVHLYYYEEMRVDEIAAALGIRSDAVKMRLSRARAELRRRLNGKGEE